MGETLFEFTIPADLKDLTLPTPEEYDYWIGRKNRIFYIDYEIDESYQLLELSKIIFQMNIDEKDTPEEELKPIYLLIHSYGGNVEQSNYFCDLIISSRIPIYTVAMGVAMSCGFLIFLSGHKRYCFKHSQLLVHEGYASFQGTASEIEEAQKNYQKQLDAMKTYILERTEIDEKVFNKNKKKDWYLTPEEIERYKISRTISSLTEIF